MKWSTALALVLPLSAVSPGCNFAPEDIKASEIPDKPVFWTDVLPILDDHCTLCHAHPTNYGAPGGFRLDQYADDKAHGLRGAKAMAHEAWGEMSGDAMPPAGAWGDGVGPNKKKLFKKWVDQGAVECLVADDCPEANARCSGAHLCLGP